ncbi:MAG: alpha-2-macroglobulin family protein [Phycisphaerales bacterium]
MKLRLIGFLTLLIALPAWGAVAAPGDAFKATRDRAESFYQEQSYAQALEAYESLQNVDDLAPAQRRWLEFRKADLAWRVAAAAGGADTGDWRRAVDELTDLVRTHYEREPDHDPIYALICESIADAHWRGILENRLVRPNWDAARTWYERALDYWAGSSDIDRARERYTDIVWGVHEAGARHHWGHRTIYFNRRIIENAMRIAESDLDQARLNLLYATSLQNDPQTVISHRRLIAAYEAAVEKGAGTEWHDDAVWQFARFLESRGRAIITDEGELRFEPDFKAALRLYRMLAARAVVARSQYSDDAQSRIEEITSPRVSVDIGQNFLPGSETEFVVAHRNVGAIRVQITPVDLAESVEFKDGQDGPHGWASRAKTRGRPVREMILDIDGFEDHHPGYKVVRLDEKLPAGAYVVTAVAKETDEAADRDVLLVTDLSTIVKVSQERAVVFCCDALTGAPVENASITAVVGVNRNRNHSWFFERRTLTTDGDGLAVISMPDADDQRSAYVFVTARSGDRQSAQESSHWRYRSGKLDWRVYAYTDRPAYRPEETAKWKVIARARQGGGWSTPDGDRIHFRIESPSGEVVKEGELRLDEFGAASGDLELTADMRLGLYRMTIRDSADDWIGNTELFRLEEYKLPEFKVTLEPPSDDEGRTRALLMGERAAVELTAEYYFGGPVANADTSYVIYKRPFHHWWAPQREFDWLHTNRSTPIRSHWGWNGEEVARGQTRTDADGRAIIDFDTPDFADSDLTYSVECTVTDASRREVQASSSINVTQQAYFAYLHPSHQIYRPGDRVEVDVRLLDANDRPVAAEGRMEVMRLVWREIWRLPDGSEVSGAEIQRMQRQLGRQNPLWMPIFKGYEEVEILERTIVVEEDGESTLEFTPPDEGYYRIDWSSRDPGRGLIRASTTVWVADEATERLGYHPQGVDIIIDEGAFREGESASVMITAPTSGGYVLFAVEREGILEWRVERMVGTAKLIRVDITDAHIPNCWLTAYSVSDAAATSDTEEIVVPPTKHFLNVAVEPASSVLRPGDSDVWSLHVTDHQGEPVSADVSIGLVDESVYAIQPELAPDIQAHFYGDRAAHTVTTNSSFDWRAYGRVDPRDEAEDERFKQDGQGIRMASYSVEAESLGAAPAPQSSVAGRRSRMQLQMGDAVASDRVDDAGIGGGGAAPPQVAVRQDFRSTVLWLPSVRTDRNGRATVTAEYPDNLTQWRATARAVTRGADVGGATATARTRLPLTVRLQAPRFFVVGDEVVISANVNNNTEDPMTIDGQLKTQGVEIIGYIIDGRPTKRLGHPALELQPGAEGRFDWLVRVGDVGDGEAELRVTARDVSGTGEADAMSKPYPIFEHGIDKQLTVAGRTSAEETDIRLDLPDRREPSTELTVSVTPSIAVMMLDALPYLIDYPYGCTEQTVSRFIPAAISRKTLEDLGLHAEDVSGRLFGGIDPAFIDKTQKGKRPRLDELDAVIEAGLERLYDFQRSDGSWGWWKNGSPDRYMTAYVLWSLSIAESAGVEIRQDVTDRAAAWLRDRVIEDEEYPERQAWTLHALAEHHAARGLLKMSNDEIAAADNVWRKRGAISPYAKALLAMALHNYGDSDRAEVMVRNLENAVTRDRTPDQSVVQRGADPANPDVIGTARWGSDGRWWRWYEGPVESTSFVLRALTHIDPDHELVEPAMNWLVRNRRGAQWTNTRDSAIAVLALNSYLRASGETLRGAEFEILVNGRSVARKQLTPEEIIAAPATFSIDSSLIRDENTITIRRIGDETPELYFTAHASFFSLEEPIEAAGSEIFARRQYYRLVPRPTLLEGVTYDRVPLNDGDEIRSGERIDVVLTVESKNDYEYLLFEDLKPAGIEAMEVQSGYGVTARELTKAAARLRFGDVDARKDDKAEWDAGKDESDYTHRRLSVYRELRDRNVALFLDRLPQGVWEMTYQYRAEIPGRFHALPVMGHAMYAPEISCNGREVRIRVLDRD